MAKTAWRIGAGVAVILILLLSQEIRDLAKAVGSPIPPLPIPYGGSGLDNLLAVLIVAAGAWLLLRRPAGLARDLGLRFNGWRGPVLAAVATLPFWIGVVWLGKPATDWSALDLVMLAFAFPLAEEIVFRGFGFVLTRRALGWPMGLAIAVQALGFGAIHWMGAGGDTAGLQIFAITALGAVLFAVVDAIDGYTIWSGFVIHVSMNAVWVVCTPPDSMGTGWVGNALRLATAALALFLFWRFGRRGNAADVSVSTEPTPALH
ncbi:CPBP family intramembrane glutamic endopeptidase [Sphingomonas sp.]|uniref:CPBP family intramembrane glutamic endopeptidase n=1 Tax=Sphingomonas sp. TaxID=28214 RepID=UPI002DBF61B5|nr:CPBP family intramembrane glutamic endopeptidase [Sphingomonas sp.]HEU4969641.1 CPBP family intramembrane glutamic endopeptidase [Sphingomonas sp.]